MTASTKDGAVADGSAAHAGRPYLWMLIAAASLAVMAEFANALTWGNRVDSHSLVVARSGLALMFAIALVRGAGVRFVVWRPLSLWMRSLSGSVSMVCTFYAWLICAPSEVLTIANVFPIWVALLSWPMFGEAPGTSAWIAIALGITGVALVEQPHVIEGNFASIVVLIGSIFTAVAMLGLHRLREIDPRAIVAHFSGVATAVCVTLAVAGGREVVETSQFNLWTLGLLLSMGTSATIGQIFLTKAFASGPPAKVSVVALSQVPMVLALDVLIGKRYFNYLSLLGIALVVAPTAWLLLRQQAVAGPRPDID